MKKVVLCVLGAIVTLSILFYSHGGKEILTILVGLALPAVPAWVIWQVVKLLKGPSVSVSPEEEKRLKAIAHEHEYHLDSLDEDPSNAILVGNMWHFIYEDDD